MKSVNNFAVTGFVGQDAKINKFNNASVARFGLFTVEGYFKPEEYEKDGQKHQVITFVATKVSTGDDENTEEEAK